MHHVISDNPSRSELSPNIPAEGFMRLKHIIGPTGPVPVSKSTWWNWIAQGTAPKPIKLGGASAWAVEDIRAMIARLKGA